MKKSFILTAALAALTLGFAAIAPVSVHASSALDDLGTDVWTPVSGANTITATKDGTTFTVGGNFGARVGYKVPVNLDGLEFDYKFSKAGVPQAEQMGFYFSDGMGKYFSECSTTTFTFMAGLFDKGQTSLFINKNHDYNQPMINHRDADMASGTGFHAANRLVTNSLFDSNDNTIYEGYHFKFVNHNDAFLKLEISELYPETIWGDNFNYAKVGNVGTVTTYLPKAEIAFADAAKLDTYINVYSMEIGAGKDTKLEVNNLTDKYIKEAEGFATAVIDELTCDATGETAPAVDQWNALKVKYEALSDNAKAYFTNGIGSQVKAALAKYDFIINKYLSGYDDFMARRSQGSASRASMMNSTNIIMIVMAVAIAAITGISALVIYKRKALSK